MNINNVIYNVIVEQSDAILKTSKSKPIVDAIKKRNPVSFYYSGPRKPKKESVKAGKRVRAEIVALGLSKKGNLIVRAYVQPPSVSKKGYDKHGWRTFMVSRMSNVEILKNEVFGLKRDKYKEGQDNSMSVTYVTTDWNKQKPAKKPIESPVKKPEPITKEPTVKGTEIEPKDPINKPEELPQPKPEKKPEPIKGVEVEPEEPNLNIEPDNKPEELPQPKPDEKPNDNPEDKRLQETMLRFKTLICY